MTAAMLSEASGIVEAGRVADMGAPTKPPTDEPVGLAVRSEANRLRFTASSHRLTHQLFRYPAKLHPPVAQALIEAFTNPGDWILDPFCGSGTVLVEAAAAGRNSLGTDVDPVAVAVARSKTHRFHPSALATNADTLLANLQPFRRPPSEYRRLMFDHLEPDISRRERTGLGTWIPDIPNIEHWFRDYVINDLARILMIIDSIHMPSTHRHFFKVVFASIVRNSSNADPVPVSGLEVTSDMRRRDAAGRIVDPFTLFERAVHRAIPAAIAYHSMVSPHVRTSVKAADATTLTTSLHKRFDCVITSPPYHNAVDYYRRHALEMYWLGLTRTHDERLRLLPRYIGRARVPQRHPLLAEQAQSALVQSWENSIRPISPQRALDFRHYHVAMEAMIRNLAGLLPSGRSAVFIVGHSSWNGSEIPTTDLFKELSTPYFTIDDVLWYPIKNRYMSYSRRNGASIQTEYVLVLRRIGA